MKTTQIGTIQGRLVTACNTTETASTTLALGRDSKTVRRVEELYS